MTQKILGTASLQTAGAALYHDHCWLQLDQRAGLCEPSLLLQSVQSIELRLSQTLDLHDTSCQCSITQNRQRLNGVTLPCKSVWHRICGARPRQQNNIKHAHQLSCGLGWVEQDGTRRCKKDEALTSAVLASRLLLDPRLSSISNSMSSLHTGQANMDCRHTKICCCRYDLCIVTYL